MIKLLLSDSSGIKCRTGFINPNNTGIKNVADTGFGFYFNTTANGYLSTGRRMAGGSDGIGITTDCCRGAADGNHFG